MLSSLLYEFEQEKSILFNNHKIVLEYLNKKELNINLDEIYNILNKNNKSNPYDIYIIDNNFKIINSTLKSDIGFDLSFAKDTFLQHKQDNITGISGPIYEEINKCFFSYTDSFITNKNKDYTIQVSYKYKNHQSILDTFNIFLSEHTNLKSINAYMKYSDHIIFDFPILNFRDYKPSVNEYIKINNHATNLLNHTRKEYQSEKITINDIEYRQLSIIDNLEIENESGHIILNILLNNDKYINQRDNLVILIFSYILLAILLVLTTYLFFDKHVLEPIDTITNYIKNNQEIKDKQLLTKNDEIGVFVDTYNNMYTTIKNDINLKSELISKQDIFVKNAIHEINTPLNIMLLNNELRERKHGKDNFSKYITSSIKTLENTFQDLSYMMNQSKQADSINIDLVDILKKRIEYFNPIFSSENKKIILESNINLHLDIYLIDISRFIDNNISNAIKYSSPNTTITIKLYKENNNIILSFHNVGLVIKDKIIIFDRYFREDNIQGGYGIGLHIVNTICNKHNYKIDVHSDKRTGTTFSYTIKND